MALDDGFEFEPSDHEPDEWDPEAEYRDPDSDSITIPEVSTPASEVSSEIARPFWTIVLVLNVAILFVSLGPMLLYFRGDVRIGLALIVAGFALFAMAYRRYRAFERTLSARDDPSERADSDGDGPTETNSTTDAEPSIPNDERDDQ